MVRMIIKAITLIQPWASLKAYDEKGNETRSWGTLYRGLMAIHAGLKIDYEACKNPWIKAALQRHGINSPDELPTGCILAVCQVFDCVKMIDCPESRYGVKLPGYKLTDQEYHFGHYEPGRYAWILANTRRPLEPIAAKGKQGLWDFDTKNIKFRGQKWD
jgi:hypothetical protein